MNVTYSGQRQRPIFVDVAKQAHHTEFPMLKGIRGIQRGGLTKRGVASSNENREAKAMSKFASDLTVCQLTLADALITQMS
jgi:hypothetical protein